MGGRIDDRATPRPNRVLRLARLPSLIAVVGLALVAAPAAEAVPPANDTAATAETIPDGPYPINSSTVADITEATTTGDPPLPSCQASVSRSIWFKLTPGQSRAYRLSTAADAPTASTVDDTVMAIYTSAGGDAGPFTELPTSAAASTDGCDDDSAAFEAFQSVISTRLQAGTEYWIVISKFGTTAPTAGNTAVQLRIDRLPDIPNDTGANAIPLQLNITQKGDLAAALNDYELSGSGCFSGIAQTASTAPGGDAVYSFVAPDAGSYSFRSVELGAMDPVLYLASALPGGPAPQTVTECLGAANRNSTNAAEEVALSLSAGQSVFVVVDVASGANEYEIIAERATTEVEPNDTPATATSPGCGTTGSIAPAGDADFWSLGSPPSGSRVFAMTDGGAGTGGDTDLRVTTATDTLEYDNFNATLRYGSLAAAIAGTPLVGGPGFLRVNHLSAATQFQPYRIYSVTQPPIGNATAESEPNDSVAQANSSPIGYLSGGLATAADVDVFAIPVPAGAHLFVALDADPLRDNTPFNAALRLFDPSEANALEEIDDGGSTSNITSGAGTLTGTTPSSPAEVISYRAPAAGTYYVRVRGPGASFGDYLLSMAVNCNPPVQLSLSPNSLPNATVGSPYSQGLTASGSSAPYSFQVVSGSLPGGLGLAANGTISGTPTAAGGSSFTVQAQDSDGFSAQKQYSLTVAPPDPGPTPDPDPIQFERSLRLKYDQDEEQFEGKLKSVEKSCAAKERIAVYSKEKGKDPKVGTDKSNNKGIFEVDEKDPDGTFYALAKESSEPAGTCLAARSKNLKLG